MKVCLINPPHPYLVDPKSQVPLGLLQVASALLEKGVDLQVVDIVDKQYNDDFDLPFADLYGITASVLDLDSLQAVASYVKRTYPEAKVVVGGPVWVCKDEIDFTHVDSIVIGEGEQTIFDIINDYPNVRKVYYSTRIKDLNVLPFPDRDLIKNKGGNVFVNNKQYKKSNGSAVFLTARGCPHNCAFCASPGIWKRKVTFRSIDNIAREMDEIIERYGIYQFRLSDDTVTMNKKRLAELCREFSKRGIIWRCSVRAKPNDIDMFKLMYDSGCREISPGIESGDQRILDTLNKGTTVTDNMNLVVNARKAGLVVRVLLMCGLPGESNQTVPRNIKFLEAVDGGDSIAMTRFVPLPGTAIAQNPRKFRCEIIEKDVRKYNLYMWGPDGEREWKSFIKVDGLSVEELNDNMLRMKEFVISTGKASQWAIKKDAS